MILIIKCAIFVFKNSFNKFGICKIIETIIKKAVHHLFEGLDAGALFLFDILELDRDFLDGEAPKAEYVLLAAVFGLLKAFSNFCFSIFY